MHPDMICFHNAGFEGNESHNNTKLGSAVNISFQVEALWESNLEGDFAEQGSFLECVQQDDFEVKGEPRPLKWLKVDKKVSQNYSEICALLAALVTCNMKNL